MKKTEKGAIPLIKKKVRKQLNQSELKRLREVAHKKQNNICPILKQYIHVEDMVVDHKHRRKDIPVGKYGCGIIRGVIQRQANVIEGKISNAYIRYGLHKFNVTLPNFLRNLADYLENPPLKNLNLAHPSEKEKPKKLKKTAYNKLKKAYAEKYTGKAKFPLYPKSGKLTIKLQALFKQYGVSVEYYK